MLYGNGEEEGDLPRLRTYLLYDPILFGSEVRVVRAQQERQVHY